MTRLPSWVWLAAALLLAALLSVIQAQSTSPTSPLDMASPAPDGGLALARWLRGDGYQLRVLHSFRLPAPSASLWLLSPAVGQRPTGIAAMLPWIRRGGRLIVASDGQTASALLSELGVHLASSPSQPIHLRQPLLLAPPLARLQGSAQVVAVGHLGMTVAATSAGPVLLGWTRGRGQIWLLTAPALLDNAHLARGENRRLALNLAGPAGSVVAVDQAPPALPPPRSVLDTSWGVALLLAILGAALFRLLSGWRLGPPLPPAESRPRPTIEYVVSLAGVLRRAGSRAEVLRLYQRHLRELDPDPPAPLLDPTPPRGEAALLRRAREIAAYERERDDRL